MQERISLWLVLTGLPKVAKRAAEFMQRYGHHQLDTEHLLLALLEQPHDGPSQLLEFLKVDGNALKDDQDTILRTGPKGEPWRSEQDRFRLQRNWHEFSNLPMRRPAG